MSMEPASYEAPKLEVQFFWLIAHAYRDASGEVYS